MKKEILSLVALALLLVLGILMPTFEYKVHINMVIGLMVLIVGGDFLVRGASAIAVRLNISQMIVGLTVVALGTSVPELFISVQSALKGSPDMAMGNVVGSNICNLTLVLGAMLVIAPVPVTNDSTRIDWPVMMAASLLLFFFTANGNLQRYEGIIFNLLIISYMVFLIRKSRMAIKREQQLRKQQGLAAEEKEDASAARWIMDVLFIIAGGFGLFYGSEWFVSGAEKIFTDLGMDQRLVGIIVLAIGTSLPELVASIAAAWQKNTQMALGGLIGSNIFNILSILGFTSIIKEIEISAEMRDFDMIWMMGIAFILLPLMLYRSRLSFVSGILLLGIYFTYVFILIYTVMYQQAVPLPGQV